MGRAVRIIRILRPVVRRARPIATTRMAIIRTASTCEVAWPAALYSCILSVSFSLGPNWQMWRFHPQRMCYVECLIMLRGAWMAIRLTVVHSILNSL